MSGRSPAAILYDSNGIEMPVLSGSAIPANTRSLLVAGTDTANARTLLTDTSGRLITKLYQRPAFSIYAEAIATANNKSMIAILNASGSAVKVYWKELFIRNVRTASTTGVACQFEMTRLTSLSAATALTGNVRAYDPSDTLPADVTAVTGGTIAGEDTAPMNGWWFSTDEWGPGTLDEEGLEKSFQMHHPVFKFADSEKPYTINANAGIMLICRTNTATGTFDFQGKFEVV